MRILFAGLVSLALALAAAQPVSAQTKGKGIRLWNLTTETISSFQLSPSGQNAWGPNLTLTDEDKEVEYNERLRLSGIEPGRYDARIGYPDQRQCIVRDVEIKADAVFSIADKDLDCGK